MSEVDASPLNDDSALSLEADDDEEGNLRESDRLLLLLRSMMIEDCCPVIWSLLLNAFMR